MPSLTACAHSAGFERVTSSLQELEDAVSCKYVAANAVNALQQVYQVLGNTSPAEKAASQQTWARILLKPELRRASEACQVLEQTALDMVQAGASYQQARGQAKNLLGLLLCWKLLL